VSVSPGPTNSLLDVAGFRVGHAQRCGGGWLSGTTVVLPPEGGAVAGVDVRGGGPGTRETDLLDPRNMVERVHAVVLTGGSAFGLAAADGVVQALYDAGVGLQIGGPGEVVPIVPGAVIFDLGRGGDFGCRPGPELGAEAYAAASGDKPVSWGSAGAGLGARAGGLKGGVGSASAMLEDGTTVAALAVVNPLGSCVDPATGELYAARFCVPGEMPDLALPDPAEVDEAHRRAVEQTAAGATPATLATTIGVVATDATLTKAQCAKVAGIAHDGMARAIRPVHTMYDGDTVFGLASGTRQGVDAEGLHALLDAAGDCFTRAIAHAVLSAETAEMRDGTCRSYRDAFPSAFRAAATETAGSQPASSALAPSPPASTNRGTE
jgi:L-aminopeptidase/D-esterase-like protein